MGVGKLNLFPREYMTVSGNIFSCHHLVERSANGIKLVEAKVLLNILQCKVQELPGSGSFFCLFKSKLYLFA